MRNSRGKSVTAPIWQRVGIAFAIVGGGLCLTAWSPQGAGVDQSSSKATVRAFVGALNASNGNAMAACIKGAHGSPALQSLLSAGAGELAGDNPIQLNEMVAQGDADHASVAAEVVLGVLNARHSTVDIFRLERIGGKWLILPDAGIAAQMANSAAPGPTQVSLATRPLSTLAVIVAFPESALKNAEQARGRAEGISCLSNEKQIALGVFQYMQDHDDTYPKKSASYKDQVYPYIKSQEVFRCLLDAKGTVSYAFNANLLGTKMASTKDPANTVMVYEGRNMQMTFRHDGKAAVCFADGHARLITPAEAKNVIWYPDGKTVKPVGK